MTDRLRALVAQWREMAKWRKHIQGQHPDAYDVCADQLSDELDAALRAEPTLDAWLADLEAQNLAAGQPHDLVRVNLIRDVRAKVRELAGLRKQRAERVAVPTQRRKKEQ